MRETAAGSPMRKAPSAAGNTSSSSCIIQHPCGWTAARSALLVLVLCIAWTLCIGSSLLNHHYWQDQNDGKDVLDVASTRSTVRITNIASSISVPSSIMASKPRILSISYGATQTSVANVSAVYVTTNITLEDIQAYTRQRKKIKPRERIEDAMMAWRIRQNDHGLTKEERYEGKPWKDVPGQEYCHPMHAWQAQLYFPTCNQLHESIVLPHNTKFLAVGGYRLVWKVQDVHVHPGNSRTTIKGRRLSLALKTLKYEREYYVRQFERHGMDALVSGRLTASPRILDIYAYCGTSALYEFAPRGDLEHYLRKRAKTTPPQKVQLAHQLASALADVHHWEVGGEPWMAHTDIATRQFVRVDDDKNSNIPTFRLTDFNRGRHLLRNNQTRSTCGFLFRNSDPEITRSPEEMQLIVPQTEKIDVYSLGNVLYHVLTGHDIVMNGTEASMRRQILKGWRPPIEAEWRESTDTLIQALITAIRMCWTQRPKQRATARQVQDFLWKALQQESNQHNVLSNAIIRKPITMDSG
ncbi:Probable serine/threonine-protein kinase [Seminavis robusta]|uniref:Probable serine/threonine-protein kinase n=1 Tax=Seminavis robusta TaxID=568900 RepID=A0A9N8DHM8_9STRA|nr:Probable serine/threonine-protein kinase [Seminavis robusta]|eukprot:Sro157_g071310.1 Probable serine/threonine-protein kinase (525) ;mRNA; r:82773-84347